MGGIFAAGRDNGFFIDPAAYQIVTQLVGFLERIPAGGDAVVNDIDRLLTALSLTVVADEELAVGGDVISVVGSAEAVVLENHGHGHARPCSLLAVGTVDVDVCLTPALVVGELDGSCAGSIGGIGGIGAVGRSGIGGGLLSGIVNDLRIRSVYIAAVVAAAVDGCGKGVSGVGLLDNAVFNNVGLVFRLRGGLARVQLGNREILNGEVDLGVFGIEHGEGCGYKAYLLAVLAERSKPDVGEVAANALVDCAVSVAVYARHAVGAGKLQSSLVIAERPVCGKQVLVALGEVGDSHGLGDLVELLA